VAARDESFREENRSKMHRWRIDLVKGGVKSTPLDDIDCEFPRVDDRLVGRKARIGWVAARDCDLGHGLPQFTAIRRYDLDTGRTVTRSFGRACGVGEPVFVPRTPTSTEDDGWILATVYDGARDATDFLILDAKDITAEPVATVRLPHRIPYGFHGNWAASD
jgi:carotenoid cleavage dioxygenase